LTSVESQMEVFGELLHGFSQACINLRYIAGEEANDLIAGVLPNGWYPLEKYIKMGTIVANAYKDAPPILERVGEEMMLGWYHLGPGKDIVHKGVEFLTFKTGSEGYQSVVRGPKDIVGDFVPDTIDLSSGTAVVTSEAPPQTDERSFEL